MVNEALCFETGSAACQCERQPVRAPVIGARENPAPMSLIIPMLCRAAR